MSVKLALQRLIDACPPSIAYSPRVQAACEALDAEFNEVSEVIDEIIVLPNVANPKLVSDELIEFLAWQLHVDIWHAELMTESTRRELVLHSLEWHTYKGTRWAVEEMLYTVFMRAEVLEWYEYGGNPFFFMIVTRDVYIDPEAMNRVLRAIYAVKNARSWLEGFVRARLTSTQTYHGIVTARFIDTVIPMGPIFSRGNIFVGIALGHYISISISAPEEHPNG